jgi:protein gp37
MARQKEKQISWCDETLNVVTGCTPVREKCRKCYAARYARRGIGDFRMITTDPDSGMTIKLKRPFSNVRVHSERLEIPLHWKRKARRIFLCSMGDLFHEQVPTEFLDDVFMSMIGARTGHVGDPTAHTYLILTMRLERAAKYIKRLINVVGTGMFEHRIKPRFWLGTTIENQQAANENAPQLLRIPAGGYFVSCEPLLAP